MSPGGARVLVVEDDPAIRRFLRVTLTSQGYQAYEAASGNEALQAIPGCRPDVIVLDLGLPDMDGLAVLERIRQWSEVPVVILSVREQERDKVAALDAGADDYLTKPFGTGELLARLRAAMRRSSKLGSDMQYRAGGLTVDLARRRVLLDGVDVALTPTEYEILRALVQHAGRVVTHRQLLRMVWARDDDPDAHVLRVNVSNLRRKIEPEPARPQYLLTEPGVGYRLREPGEEEA